MCLGLSEPGRVGWPPELRGLGHHPLCITALWSIIASDVRSERGSKLGLFQLPSCSCTLDCHLRHPSNENWFLLQLSIRSYWNARTDPCSRHETWPGFQLLISSFDQVKRKRSLSLSLGFLPWSLNNSLPSRRFRKKATCFPIQYTLKKKKTVHVSFRSRNYTHKYGPWAGFLLACFGTNDPKNLRSTGVSKGGGGT